MVQIGAFWHNLEITLERFGLSPFFGCLVGFILGLIIGLKQNVRRVLEPIRWLLMSVPPVVVVQGKFLDAFEGYISARDRWSCSGRTYAPGGVGSAYRCSGGSSRRIQWREIRILSRQNKPGAAGALCPNPGLLSASPW